MLYGKYKKTAKVGRCHGLALALLMWLVGGTSWAFTDQACLMQDFEVTITKSNNFLRFLMPTLTLKKAACELTVEQKRWRWSKTWIIDVCRGPVHIKYQNFSNAAWMKKASCYGQEKSDRFCRGYQQVMNLVQEDGLIYAPGERDDLSSDHGKTYCLYLLAKNYLDEGKIFSRQASYNPALTREQNWGNATSAMEFNANPRADVNAPGQPVVRNVEETPSVEPLNKITISPDRPAEESPTATATVTE